jgi:hypothetical protein
MYRLWIHFGVLYFISLSAYALLYIVRIHFFFSLFFQVLTFLEKMLHMLHMVVFRTLIFLWNGFDAQEFKHIANLRLEYLAAVLPQPDQFTVLVQSVPKPENEELSYSDNVDFFFRRFHPIEYLSHHMVYKSSHVTKLLVNSALSILDSAFMVCCMQTAGNLIMCDWTNGLWCWEQNELERLKLKIFELKQKPPSQRKPRRAGFCGLFGPLVDPIELHMEKLEDVHRQVRQCQMEFRQKKKVCNRPEN